MGVSLTLGIVPSLPTQRFAPITKAGPQVLQGLAWNLEGGGEEAQSQIPTRPGSSSPACRATPSAGDSGCGTGPQIPFPQRDGAGKTREKHIGEFGMEEQSPASGLGDWDLGSGNGAAPKADPKQLIPNSSSQRLIPSVPGLGAPHSWDTGCALTRHLPSPKACGTGNSGTGPLPGGRNPKSAEWGRAGLSLLFPPASILSSFPWVE